MCVSGADEILNEMAIDPREDKTAFEGDDDAEDGSISLDQIKQSYVMQVEKGPLDDMDGGNVDSQGLPIVCISNLYVHWSAFHLYIKRELKAYYFLLPWVTQ